MSATRRDPPMSGPKWDGIYEIGSLMDIYSQVNELSQKMDRLLQAMPISTPPTSTIDICSICSSPAHSIYDCHVAF